MSLAEQKSTEKIEARSYQLRLVDYVTKRNGIIYLPTGSGKTYVAILALKRFSQHFDKSLENGGKRGLFICNTVELARQQAVAMKKYTSFKVGFYVGERDVDNWKRSKWDEEIGTNQVLVGTAQVMLDMIVQKYLSLGSVSIIIFDECHHGTGQHPYHEIMRFFQCAGPNVELPRVIGLTGVLIKGNEIKDVGKKLKKLETTYWGNIITVSDMKELENVMLYSTKPRELLIKYPSQMFELEVVNVIRSQINSFYDYLAEVEIGKQPVRMSKGLQTSREPNKKSYLKSVLNDFLHQLTDFGIYTGSIAILAVAVELEIKMRNSETIALRSMYRSAITVCEKVRHMLLRKLRDMLDDDEEESMQDGTMRDEIVDKEEIIMNFSTPKIQKFLLYLKQTFGGKQLKDICCLVFVERRYSAKCIYGMLLNFIEATPELRNVLVPQFMVGRNGLSGDFDSVLERKWQKTAIQQFRDGECNMIVCSSVLEEGIDVQACNYVIILDPLKTFNMYVQTKGRARSKDAVFLLFSSDIDAPKCSQQISQYREAHTEIAAYLKERTLERAEPQIDEINEHFQDAISPYHSAEGAVLLASSALALLNRYCQHLPMDAFGVVLPWFELLPQDEKVKLNKAWETKCVVSVTLPLTSSLRETIYSDPMSCNKWAKISAAFKACVKLYHLGELNERFLPKTVRERVAAIADEHFEHWKKYGDDVMTKHKEQNNTRCYPVRCPDELYDALPRVGEICYAYEIAIEPQFESSEYTAHMHDQLRSGGNYALLLRKRLPRLAEMPLFSNQGKVHVRVANEPQELSIESAEQLEQLQRFHLMIFRDLLRIWQPFFVLDRRSKEHSFLVVPLAAAPAAGLDMQLVKQFQTLTTPRGSSLAERQKQPPPRAEDFEGRIVTQWYANYEHKRMLVTKVHTDLSPLSMMEDKQKNNSYYDFTMAKYSRDIGDVVHKQQFLIEVRVLTDRFNFYVNQRGKSSLLNRARAKVVLIPELCHNFHFPGALWLKLLFLPSILRRLNFMLHAESVRVRINRYLGLAELPLNGADYRPQPLTIDWSLRRNVDEKGDAVAEEEFEEPKSLLEPLPLKAMETSTEKLDISELEVPWQQYMEPVDLSRKIMLAFPVELSYYHRFISGHLLGHERLEHADKELWAQRQFHMRPGNIYGNKCSAKSSSEKPALMPAAPSSDQVCSADLLAVLQRSISNEHITAAEQGEFLAALTTAGSVDIFDMERFELLGDCFLKLSATLYLANKYPDWNEGILTQVKSTLVSNRNLLYCLSETDLPQRICNSLFTPKYTWLPPSISLPHNVTALWTQEPELAELIGPHNLRDLTLSEREVIETGECSEQRLRTFLDACRTNRQTHHAGLDFGREVNFFVGRAELPDKVVADTLEALLGVVVKNYGLQHGFRMLEYFGICKPDIGKPLTQLLDLQLGSSRMRANISSREVDAFLLNHTDLEANLGYQFRDRAYLLQALTHPSFPTNRLTGCYQELEFIGDAILDFLISAYIFEHKTLMRPGELTDLRSALVNNTTLACICVRHRFHFFILAENALLTESIKNFAEFQETQGHRVTNHVRILLEESEVQPASFDSDDEADELEPNGAAKPVGAFNLSDNVDVPKALGDVVEALIAAIYLDCRDLDTTWRLVYKLFEPELLEFSRNVPINPIRQLHEHKLANPKFSAPAIEQNQVMISCQFTCIDKLVKVHGFGNNSKQAKLAAAKHALQKLTKCET